jgi:thioredoxin-related protein
LLSLKKIQQRTQPNLTLHVLLFRSPGKIFRMAKLFLATIFFSFALSQPVWMNNLENAKELAKNEHKFILLNFSGSDWCIPCIRLRKEVFNTEAFDNYASQNLILVNADFPRTNKNKLSKEQQKLNDALAEKYNLQGSFPLTLLLDSNGNKLKVWDGFYKDGAQNFVYEIQSITSSK